MQWMSTSFTFFLRSFLSSSLGDDHVMIVGNVLICNNREYQIKHEEYLRQKASKSAEKHQQILDKAKADIDNFYKERALKRDKVEAANRYVVCNSDVSRDEQRGRGGGRA